MTVWTDAAHAGWVASLVDMLGSSVQLLAVGGIDAGAHALSESLGAAHERDLRKLLVDRPASFLLVSSFAVPSAAELRHAVEAGTTVLTVEPLWADLDELDAARESGLHGRVVMVPRFERCPGFVSAADPAGSVGRPCSVRMSSAGPRAQGSWFARSFDAWRVVLGFIEMPETIDAATLGESLGTASEARRSASVLRQFTGRSSAIARCADGSIATVEVADDAPPANVSRYADGRRLDAHGPTGRLTVTDHAYELVHLHDDGSPPTVDTLDPPAGSQGDALFVDLVATHVRRLIDRPPLPANPALDAHALACIHATLLSARTNQPENPAKLLQLVA